MRRNHGILGTMIQDIDADFTVPFVFAPVADLSGNPVVLSYKFTLRCTESRRKWGSKGDFLTEHC